MPVSSPSPPPPPPSPNTLGSLQSKARYELDLYLHSIGDHRQKTIAEHPSQLAQYEVHRHHINIPMVQANAGNSWGAIEVLVHSHLMIYMNWSPCGEDNSKF